MSRFDEPDGLRSALATRLRDRRAALGSRQEDIADAAGITRSQLANIEAGRSLPSLFGYVGLCIALDVDPGLLLRAPECSVCGDAPPPRFTCNACGAGSPDPRAAGDLAGSARMRPV